MLDVEPIVRLAHERGAMVLLDAYQSAGSVPLDVRALGVEFLAAGSLKYLLGSAGLAWLYARRDAIERIRPTATGWFADEDIFAMDVSDYSPARDARRFQYGTPPVPSIYAGIAGIELMEEIGVEDTRAHVEELNRRLIDGLDDLRATVVTPAQAPAPRRARLRPLARRRRARGGAAARGDRHLVARGQPAHLGARLQLGRGRRPRARVARAAPLAARIGLDFDSTIAINSNRAI